MALSHTSKPGQIDFLPLVPRRTAVQMSPLPNTGADIQQIIAEERRDQERLATEQLRREEQRTDAVPTSIDVGNLTEFSLLHADDSDEDGFDASKVTPLSSMRTFGYIDVPITTTPDAILEVQEPLQRKSALQLTAQFTICSVVIVLLSFCAGFTARTLSTHQSGATTVTKSVDPTTTMTCPPPPPPPVTIVQNTPLACPQPTYTPTPPARATTKSKRPHKHAVRLVKQPNMITHQFPPTGWKAMIDQVAQQHGTTTAEILDIGSNRKILESRIANTEDATNFVLIIPSRRP